MAKCKYSTKFLNFDSKEVDWKCEDKSLDSGFCIHHDSKYFKEHPKDLADSFRSSIKENNRKGKILLAIGYHFPKIKLKFDFQDYVYFSKSIFHEDVDFSNAKFSNMGIFTECKFKKRSNFSNCTFKNLIDFAFCEFNNAIFKNSVFKRGAIFGGSKFENTTDFTNIVSNLNISFHGSVFKDVFFNKSQMDNMTFSRCKSNKTNLSASTIKKGNFDYSYIKEGIFAECFLNNINLNNTKIDSSVFYKSKLYKCTFQNNKINTVLFTDCTINETHLDFIDCAFFSCMNSILSKVFITKLKTNDGKLLSSTYDKCDFFWCDLGTILFSFSTFKDSKFYLSKFNEVDFTDSKFQGNVEFRNIQFKNPELVSFDVKDLSNVSFVNTDISRIKFGDDVRWGKDGFTIIDDIKLRKNPDKANLNSVLSIYRNLRENYEYRLKYDEAGKFFIKEMNLKREFMEV